MNLHLTTSAISNEMDFSILISILILDVAFPSLCVIFLQFCKTQKFHVKPFNSVAIVMRNC
jgi:hypothetical protein